MKLKNDQYRKARGGKSKMLEICCARCNSNILTYQKDGDGGLLRCYLNRIFYPEQYEKLQHITTISKPQHMPNLTCVKCNALIGTPMMHLDNRLAFRLHPGTFKKRVLKNFFKDGKAY